MDQRILQIIQKHLELKSEFEEIYPELKESEDEKIRSAMIRGFNSMMANHPVNTFAGVSIRDIIAYLEKQKEQKPFSQEVFDAAKHEALWGETAYNAEDIEELRALKAKIDESMEDPITKPAEKQDYADLNDLERTILRGFLAAGVENVPVTIIKETAKECLAQMKPAEWSEEDEKNIEKLDGFLTEVFCYGHVYVSQKDKEELQCWLKSLHPDSYKNCNSRWKPSEEQMEALMLAIEGKCAPTSYMSRRLEDLYDALVNEFHVECKLDK